MSTASILIMWDCSSTGREGLRPCTPAGVIQLLKRYDIPMAGKNAVVVGRSDIVGKPMAMLLLQENATVTICHSRTRDLPGVCRTADILVAAIGRAAMVTADYIKPGAVVIDVGMNRVDSRAEAERIFDPARLADFDRRGSLLVGDVHPGDMARLSSAYTPVPGGVGPLTIAMLMRNTIESAERRTASLRMLIVGLTGGMACGKSFVAGALRDLGCDVIEADETGREVMQPGGEAYAAVVAAFGHGHSR